MHPGVIEWALFSLEWWIGKVQFSHNQFICLPCNLTSVFLRWGNFIRLFKNLSWWATFHFGTVIVNLSYPYTQGKLAAQLKDFLSSFFLFSLPPRLLLFYFPHLSGRKQSSHLLYKNIYCNFIFIVYLLAFLYSWAMGQRAGGLTPRQSGRLEINWRLMGPCLSETSYFYTDETQRFGAVG